LLPRERLRKEADKLLKSFLEEIQPLAPKCVVLFGSYARGDFTEGSDIDVCVIAENLPRDELARRCLTGLYSTPNIRAIGFHPEEFLQYLTGLRFLSYDIMADGVVLYDSGFFSEMKRVYGCCLRKHGIVREKKGWNVTLVRK